MTARPTFSVAIAAYQAADTVGQAVASALAQTVPPVDVAVCDDGSTDEIDAALAQYRDRIVLVRQENRGEAAAKNAAARATSGEFVAFLDADDLYYPERLAALGELAASRPDLDVLTTNADLEVDGRVVGRYYPDIATFPAERQAEGVIASDSAIFGAVAIRRSVFEAAGGLRESLWSSDDWELWLRLALGGTRFGLVDTHIEHDVVAQEDHDLPRAVVKNAIRNSVIRHFRKAGQQWGNRESDRVSSAVSRGKEAIEPVIAKVVRNDLLVPAGAIEFLVRLFYVRQKIPGG